jgi:hypothetical protein
MELRMCARSARLLVFGMSILVLGILPVIASTPLKPLNGKPVTVQLKSKQHLYHFVTKTEPVKLEVAGPVKIEVLTRLAIPASATGKIAYAIVVSEGGKQIKQYKTTTEVSDVTFVDDPSGVGKSRKCSLEIPEGEHTFVFALESEIADHCALRFALSGKNNLARALHGKSVRVEPLSYDRVVTAVVAEKLITYYVATKEKPIQLRVIGPTDVVVDARLNFDAKMIGKQSYTIAVVEGAKTLLTAPLTSTKSVGAFYKDWKEVVPGKINLLRLGVPAGEHLYQFVLKEGLASSVSLKFSIPEKAVTNIR